MKKVYMTILLAAAALFIMQQSMAGPTEDLIASCKQGNIDGVRKAIEAGADVNKADADGHTAIASAYFWPDITRLLLDKGADPNGGVYPALISACNVYSVDVVKMLLDAGADPNKPGMSDPKATFRTLIAAEQAKGKKANQAAIKAWEGAMSMVKPSEANGLRILIQQTNCVPCLEMMLEKGAKTDFSDGNNAMDVMASFSMSKEERKAGCAASPAAFAAFGVKVPEWYINLSDELNGTAVDMFNLLVSGGVDVNKPNTLGFTPLVTALKGLVATPQGYQSKLDVVNAMIDKGADPAKPAVWKQFNSEYYPVCLAAELGTADLVKKMVEKGADMNVSEDAVNISCYTSYVTDIGAEGGEGFTPVIIAILANKPDIVNYLVDKGADLTIGTKGFAVLATKVSNLNCLCTVKNKSPLFWAIEHSDMAAIEKIATKLQGVKLPDFSSRTWGSVAKGNTGNMVCVQFKKDTYSPSEYADIIGHKEAYKKLKAMGL
jgi:ankyrin repeat protein